MRKRDKYRRIKQTMIDGERETPKAKKRCLGEEVEFGTSVKFIFCQCFGVAFYRGRIICVD